MLTWYPGAGLFLLEIGVHADSPSENLFMRTFPLFRSIALNFFSLFLYSIRYILIFDFAFLRVYEEDRWISFCQEFPGHSQLFCLVENPAFGKLVGINVSFGQRHDVCEVSFLSMFQRESLSHKRQS